MISDPAPKRWQDLAAAKQAANTALVTSLVKLDPLPGKEVLNVTAIPKASGLLSPLDLEITESESVEGLLAKIAEGKYSAVEVTTAFCKRAAIAHQLTNCLTEIFFDKALKRAEELDEYYKKTGKTVGPLHGLPISLKDQIEVEGTEHTMCYVGWLGKIAKHNAVLVEILLKQGAVLYVRTNMSQGLWFGEGYNNLFGRTLNPRNRNLGSGGSSGGEGALGGMRGSILGVGSDIGGSIRIPAAFNGLYGLRGCYSRIPYCNATNSSEGQESIRSVLGPLTPAIDGLKVFYKAVLAGQPWELDPWTPRMPWSEEMYHLGEHGGEGAKLCFGIMEDDGLAMPQPPYFRAMKAAKEAILAAGHEVISYVPYKPEESLKYLGDTFNADGGADLKKQLALTGEPRLNDILDREAKAMSIPDYWALSFARSKFLKASLDHWNATASQTSTGRPIDAIVCPIGSSLPQPHDGPISVNYTSFCNVADYASAVVPVTRVKPEVDVKVPPHEFRSDLDKLTFDRYDPEYHRDATVSIQVIGKKYEEEAVIRMAEIVDAALKKAGVQDVWN